MGIVRVMIRRVQAGDRCVMHTCLYNLINYLFSSVFSRRLFGSYRGEFLAIFEPT